MNLSLSKYSWLSDISENQLYKKLVLQVKKDFELTGLNIDISENTAPDTLVAILSHSLLEIIQYKFDSFMQLLYRIDIAEKLIISNEIETSEVLAEKATYLILQREWQKVEWRERFVGL